MLRRSLLALVLLLRVGTTPAQEFPESWEYFLEIQTQPGLVRLEIPAEVAGLAKPGLEDLRLVGTGSAELPFLLRLPERTPSRSIPPEWSEVRLTEGSTTVRLKTGVSTTLEAIGIESPDPSFLKSVTVEGSRNGRHWSVLAERQPIFRYPGTVQKQLVKIPEGEWAWLRLVMDDRSSPAIAVTAVQLWTAGQKDPPGIPLATMVDDRSEFPEETRLTVRLPHRNLYVSRLRIATPELFFNRSIRVSSRHFEGGDVRPVELGEGTVYRVPGLEGRAIEELSLDVFRQVRGNEIVLAIQNADSPPLQIDGVEIDVVLVALVFSARQGEDQRIYFGNTDARRPRYDLEALHGRLSGNSLGNVQVGPVKRNPAYIAPEVLPEVSRMVAEIDLSDWQYRKPVLLTQGGIQRLELDSEVLSRARPQGEDLRLVQNSRQLAYLVDRVGVVRQAQPLEIMADKEDEPRTSRWILRLGNRRLPLTHIACSVSEPVFRRSARLYEELEDSRGRRGQRQLGESRWIRNREDLVRELQIKLDQTPHSDTLILEINNTDNPPLALEGCRVMFRAPRVLFRAEADTETWLYYGNARVLAPDYDIDLVADEMLGAQKSDCWLGTQEDLRAAWWGSDASAGKAQLVFWLGLGSAVVLLLWVLSRLLPEHTTGSG